MKKIQKNELEKIISVIGVPLFASGLDSLLNKSGLNKDKIVNLFSDLEKDLHMINDLTDVDVSKYDLTLLSKVYNFSLEEAESFDDIHTLTSYESQELHKVGVKLENLVRN